MLKLSGFWLKTAILFLVRSGRSTAALSLMVVSAVATLIFLSALAVGVNDAMIRNSTGLFAGHISGYGLPAQLAPGALAGEGVKGVAKRVPAAGILSGSGQLTGVVLLGIEPEVERSASAFWKKTVEGSFLSTQGRGLFISRALAENLAVAVGGTLTFSARDRSDFREFTVDGIYETGIEPLDRGIAFCTLAAHPDPQQPWSAAVFLEDGVDPDDVIARYRTGLPEGDRFKSWSDLMPDLRQLIELNYVSMSLVMVLVFGVVSLGIACAFVIFIMKHMREYGIMKAMGVTAGEMMRLIIMEIMLMNCAASIVGITAGVVAVLIVSAIGIDLTAFTSYNRYFAVSGVIYPRLTAFSLWSPPALALVFSLAAALWPAVLVARKKAADILRVG
ncbi:MAG: ABC transporter permease [Deltaproteobacteria bacterium]|nr:ABC transporter permease [Deltaproteobacteria bacterium]